MAAGGIVKAEEGLAERLRGHAAELETGIDALGGASALAVSGAQGGVVEMVDEMMRQAARALYEAADWIEQLDAEALRNADLYADQVEHARRHRERAERAERELERVGRLAALVSGVLCDAGDIPVADIDDVAGLGKGLEQLLAQRDELRRKVSAEAA